MWRHRTLPAGYMENGESASEGAVRETWEEARAKVEVLSPFAQLDIPLIGQVSHQFLWPFFLTFKNTKKKKKHIIDYCKVQCYDYIFFFGTDLYNILGEVVDPTFFTGSRIIRMPAFCTWWYPLWISFLFINARYLKFGMFSCCCCLCFLFSLR